MVVQELVFAVYRILSEDAVTCNIFLPVGQIGTKRLNKFWDKFAFVGRRRLLKEKCVCYNRQ